MASKKRVQVYFNKHNQDVYKAVLDMARKNKVSSSTIAMYAIEAGLGVVQKHYEGLRSIRESHPIKK